MSALQTLQEQYQTQVSLTFVRPVRVVVSEEVAHLLHSLATNLAWHERKIAAQKLADAGGEEARTALLEALLNDPFWMVRCAIVQALERIGDTDSVSVLQTAAATDPNEIVRQYAVVAVERLSFTG